MKPVYHLLSILFLLLGLTSCVDDPVVETSTQNARVPEISATEKLTISASSIELSANIIKENGTPVREYGFCWSNSAETDPKVNISEKRYVVSENMNNHHFTATIDNLDDDTKYYVYAYAANDVGMTFSSNAGIYTTNLGVGEVSTCKIDKELIKAVSVTVSGKVKSRGEGIEQLGFYWSDKNTEPSSKDSVVYYEGKDIHEVDSFACNLTGLKPETTYYVRAFANNKFGEFSYSVESFKTTSGKPAVGSLKVDSVRFTSIDLSAVVMDQGESELVSYGFCWGTTDELSVEKSDKVLCHQLEEGTNKFAGSIKGLKPNTRYTVCAFVTNEFGTVYTPVKALFTRSDALIVSVSPIEKSTIVNRKALLDGQLVNKEHLQIDEVGFCWSDKVENPTIDDEESRYVKLPANGLTGEGRFSYMLEQLPGSKTYYVNAFVKRHNGPYEYSPVTQQFSTPDIFQEIGLHEDLKGLTFSSSFAMNDMLYILGGDRGSSCSADFYSYNPEQNIWNGFSPLFTEAGHMTVSTVHNRVYVMGGLTKSGLLDNMTEYDYVLNRWRTLKAMPEASFDAHSFVFHDSVYVVGGELASSEISNKLYRYDIEGSEWKLVTDNFPVRQKKGVSFVLGDTVYVGLGEGSENRLWMSSKELTTWKEVSAIPTDLHQVNSLIHYQANGMNSLFLLDSKGQLWESDLITYHWKKRSAVFPDEVLKNSSLILVDDKIFILGQKDNNTSYLKRYNLEWDPISEIVE